MHSIAIVRYLAALAVLSVGAVAQAEQPATRWNPTTSERSCSAKPLQSAGYRDMLTRFGSQQSTNRRTRIPGFESSYRDFAARLHPVAPSFAAPTHNWPRYSLRATPTCG